MKEWRGRESKHKTELTVKTRINHLPFLRVHFVSSRLIFLFFLIFLLPYLPTELRYIRLFVQLYRDFVYTGG